MKTVKLIHNPGAGEGHPTKEELISLIESAGYNCSYLSVKEDGWKDQDIGPADFLVAAGGDGTVRKVVHLLIEKNLYRNKLPIGLLPVGTANNIASALGITGTQNEIVSGWNASNTVNYDLSKLSGLDEERFFIEGFGYGIFPFLIKHMKAKNIFGFTEDKLRGALKELLKILPTYPAKYCKMEIDGGVHEGKYILTEIMNIPGIGPNLNIAPMADPGDGGFDVVLVPESQREDFISYIEDKLNDVRDSTFFSAIRAKKVKIYCEETLLHIDDKIMELTEPRTLTAEVMSDPLLFFKGNNGSPALN